MKAALAVFAFPESHRRRIRSTNGPERFNPELRRRARMVRIFPNCEPCLRLVTVKCVEQSGEWLSGPQYLDMSLLEDRAATAPSSVTSAPVEAGVGVAA